MTPAMDEHVRRHRNLPCAAASIEAADRAQGNRPFARGSPRRGCLADPTKHQVGDFQPTVSLHTSPTPGPTDSSHGRSFIRALIGRLESTYRVDPHRLFVTGHSNGALLAFALACQMSTMVDAIAVQPPGSVLLAGEPYTGFDSSAAVWSFLAAHRRH